MSRNVNTCKYLEENFNILPNKCSLIKRRKLFCGCTKIMSTYLTRKKMERNKERSLFFPSGLWHFPRVIPRVCREICDAYELTAPRAIFAKQMENGGLAAANYGRYVSVTRSFVYLFKTRGGERRRRNSPPLAASRAGNKCKSGEMRAIRGFAATVTHVIVRGGETEFADAAVVAVKEFQLDSSYFRNVFY